MWNKQLHNLNPFVQPLFHVCYSKTESKRAFVRLNDFMELLVRLTFNGSFNDFEVFFGWLDFLLKMFRRVL